MSNTSKNLKQLSDEELVEIVQQGRGDNVHLGLLYDRYKNKVYYKCISLLKNQKDAEDLCHDIFIKIFSKLNTFRGGSKFSLWVHSITFNTCISYLSEKKKRNLFEIEDKDQVDIAIDSDELNAKQIEEMKLDHLEKVLLELRDEERILLMMKYFENLSIDQICQITGLGVSAVKMRLKRSREQLYKIYSKKFKSFEDEE